VFMFVIQSIGYSFGIDVCNTKYGLKLWYL
jgi:hypothetical protein